MIWLTKSICSGTFPLSTGTWKTSNRGTWTVDNTNRRLTNFEVTTSSTAGPYKIVMNCEDDTTNTDGYIAFKSASTYYLFGGPKYIYACILFKQQKITATDAYYFYLGASLTTLNTGVYERIILLPTSATYSLTTYCTDKSTAPDRTHVSIKDGTETAAALTCPTTILGAFSYSDTSCTSTFLDVFTTRIEFKFNYTVCNEVQMFSAGGQLLCVYSGTNGGNNYVTLYNTDTSTDQSTTYRYSCMVYSTWDKIVTASINPKECFGSSFQTPSSTNHPSGVTRTFTKYGDTDNKETDNDQSRLISVVIGVVLTIVIIAVLLCVAVYLMKVKNRSNKISGTSKTQFTDPENEYDNDWSTVIYHCKQIPPRTTVKG